MTWLMDDGIEPGAGLSLAEMFVQPGETSELHRHSNCNETLHVLEGRIRQRIADGWQEMKSGDTCLIPQGSKHQTENIGGGTARLILAYSSGLRNYEALEP